MWALLRLPRGKFFAQESNSDLVMRAAKRVKFETNGNGDKLEPLAHNSGSNLLECYLHHVVPGSGPGGTFQHEGEEFGYVLEGEIELVVSGRKYAVAKGDLFCFRSEKPHSWTNKGKVKARVLWICSPPILLNFPCQSERTFVVAPRRPLLHNYLMGSVWVRC